MTAPITDTRTEQVSRMVVQYEKDMLMLCFVYLRNMDLAQEALQESFLKAYTRFDTFRGASSEKTWLTRIVINTCKDIRRTAWFRHRSLEISAELPGAVLPPDETHIDLMDAILKLPLQSREVIDPQHILARERNGSRRQVLLHSSSSCSQAESR